MLEMMRRVLAWLRFLAWVTWYAILVGLLLCGVFGGLALYAGLWAISFYLWGVYWPGILAEVVLLFLLLGGVAAYDEGKAPK